MRILKSGCLLAAVLVSALMLSGCGKKQGKTAKPAPPPERPGVVSEVQQTVEGMAGGTAVRAGQKAKNKLNSIQQQQQQRSLDVD